MKYQIAVKNDILKMILIYIQSYPQPIVEFKKKRFTKNQGSMTAFMQMSVPIIDL